MKTTSSYTHTVPVVIKTIVLLALLISFTACDFIISNISDLPDSVPEGNNPNDPENDAFQMPKIILLEYSTANFVVNSNTLSLNWRPDTQLGGLIYRYKVASPLENIEEIAFTEYSENTSMQMDNLMETFNGEVYRYAIEASLTNYPDKIYTLNGSFQVDAFQQKGFLFRPDVIYPDELNTFVSRIYIDEIDPADELIAFQLKVNFDTNALVIADEGITVYDTEESFFYRDGGQVISFAKVEGNQIIIDAGVAGNFDNPFSGGGAVCEIKFVPRSGFTTSSIEISGESVLKQSDGSTMVIGNSVTAILTQH